MDFCPSLLVVGDCIDQGLALRPDLIDNICWVEKVKLPVLSPPDRRTKWGRKMNMMMSVVIGEINDFRMIIIVGVWDCWQKTLRKPPKSDRRSRRVTEWDKLDGKWIANDIIKSFRSFLWKHQVMSFWSVCVWLHHVVKSGRDKRRSPTRLSCGFQVESAGTFVSGLFEFCGDHTPCSTWATLCLATIIPWIPPFLDCPETSSIIDFPLFEETTRTPVVVHRGGKTLKWPKLFPYTTHPHRCVALESHL